MKLKISILWILNFIDYAATTYQVWRLGSNPHGIVLEANPLMRSLVEEPLLFFAVKVAMVSGFLAILYRFREERIARIGTSVLLAVFGILAIYHIYLLLIF